MSAADRTFGRAGRDDLLNRLSPRELEVLELMADGRSNCAIGEQLTVELKTVETHVSRVFTKLQLNEDRRENRRVLAVLTFLGRESAEAATAWGSRPSWGVVGSPPPAVEATHDQALHARAAPVRRGDDAPAGLDR